VVYAGSITRGQSPLITVKGSNGVGACSGVYRDVSATWLFPSRASLRIYQFLDRINLALTTRCHFTRSRSNSARSTSIFSTSF
jgi:hypothetical protein